MCTSAAPIISGCMCPTVLAKAPYLACSDSVGSSDPCCDYKGICDLGHVGQADRQPIFVHVFTKILIDIYSIILLLSILLYLAS